MIGGVRPVFSISLVVPVAFVIGGLLVVRHLDEGGLTFFEAGRSVTAMLDQLASIQKQVLAIAALLACAAIASIVLRRWLLRKLS